MSAISIMSVARPGLLAFAAMGVVWGGFAAALPDLKTQLGVDEARLGLLLLVTPIAAVVAMLLSPVIGHRLGNAALPISALGMAVAFVLPGQVTVAALFPLAMIFCGFGTGLTDVLMNARVAQIENDRQIHLMNLCHAAYSFGYAAGAIGTGALRAAASGPPWVMTAVAIVATLLALGTGERNGAIHGLRRPRDDRANGLGLVPVIGGAIVLIAFLTENAAESWSALHIEQTLGGSPAEGAMGPAIMALTMGIARLAGQGLASRVAAGRLLAGGAIVSALGALLAAVAISPVMAYGGFVIMGIGSSVIAPTAFSQVGRLAHPEARGRAVARATLLGYFGYFIGPPGVGFIAGAFGLRAAFVFAAVMLMAVLILAPIMARASGGNDSVK